MEQHRANAVCASCHQRMDPIGFAFENFDAIGAWRDKDGTAAVDASGVLPDGRTFDGPAGLKKILRQDNRRVRSVCDRENADVRAWPRARALRPPRGESNRERTGQG